MARLVKSKSQERREAIQATPPIQAEPTSEISFVDNPQLTIVLPIYNAREYAQQTLESIFATTKTPFELILIDDFSDDGITKQWVEQLEMPQIRLTRILNPEHKWVNYGWNLGAQLAIGKYVAILNSDIILADGWDLPLIKLLEEKTIACPVEQKSNKDKTFLQELHPLVKLVDPTMINGAAFMFKKIDVPSLFPIPFKLKHWCGDNWLADRANQMQKVGFTRASTFKHFVTRSGATLDPELYHNRVINDLDEYEHISDRDMSKIRNSIMNPKAI